MKNSRDYVLKFNSQGNYVKNSSHTKFLSLIIDDSLSWKAHVDQMMSKLNIACFVIWTIQAIMSNEILRMVYFTYVHSIMSYGIIFWGNQPYSEKILKKGDHNYYKFKNERLMYGTVYKIGNIALILTIYFLSINICDKNSYFIQIIRSIVSTQDLKPTYIHQ